MDMEITVLTVILIISLSIFLKFFRPDRRRRLPPFPGVPFPIIGHLYLLKPPLHRTLYRLSQNHGPIFSLRLGSRLVVVVSSPSLAEECFTTHDAVFANRPQTIAGKYIGYNDTTLVGLPYSDHWRHLRRLSAQEIFSAARLNSFLSIRQDEVKHLLQSLYRDSKTSFAKVELKPKLGQAAFNVIMRMIAGKRYFGENDDQESKNVPELINEVMETAEASNPEDFFPLLRWLDCRGLKKKLAALGDRMDAFQQSLIDEHRREKRTSTVIGHLLSLQESQPLFYTDLTIKGLINNMIVAGTDTSAVTMEWAMSALLNHPEVMKKARAELDRVVGCGRLVDEPDLSELPYLQCIISETFRLFPAAPLLLPHYSSQPCKVGGYEIPSDTMLLVNAWAINRDPDLWDDPMRFVPERFEGREGESSLHLLMPFGMGRRSCPGAGLARRMIGLVLASLIQCFEWKRMTKDEVDMSEGKGLTMPKAKPLEAMCKARGEMHKVLALLS